MSWSMKPLTIPGTSIRPPDRPLGSNGKKPKPNSSKKNSKKDNGKKKSR